MMVSAGENYSSHYISMYHNRHDICGPNIHKSLKNIAE
jgi:hypothetical protein